VICDLPDNESAAAFSLAINNTGKAKGRVTPLMTPEEMDRVTTKAPQYRAPGEP
jgi:GYD domain